MGRSGAGQDKRVQRGECQKSPSVEWYLSYFGLTAVFESVNVDDLNSQFENPDLRMTSELYPLLINLAEQEVAEMQKSLNQGYENDDDYKELKTPEEKEIYLKNMELVMKMSPKEFWLLMNG